MTDTTKAAEDYVFDTLFAVYRSDPQATAELAEMLVRGVIARLPDLNEDPAMPRRPSTAQRLTFEQVKKSASKRRRQVLASVVTHHDPTARPRTTSDFIEQTTGLPHTTVSATLNWLENNLLVKRDQSISLPTSAGGRANPYVLTDAGMEAHCAWARAST